MLRRHFRPVVFLTLALLVATGAPAAADAPTEQIREFFGNVNRVLADPSYDDRLPDRLAAMRALVAEIVDFRNAASFALGFEWSARSTAEREEFARLFADLLQTSVFSSVGSRARLDNGLAVTYVGELTDPNGVTVATTVLTRGGSEMAVGYRMAKRQNRWMVHDVVIDGVSIVENYRAQFQKVMQRSSYAGLVSEMRARIADLGRQAPPVAATAVVTAAPAAVVASSGAEPIPAAETAPVASAEPRPLVVVAVPVEVAAAAPPPSPPAPAVTPSPAPRSAPPVVVAAVPVRPIESRVPRAPAFWVQVGAFQNVERAIGVATALRDHAVSIITAPDQPLMRVLIGPFTERAAAAAKLREIRARGYDAFIAEAQK